MCSKLESRNSNNYILQKGLQHRLILLPYVKR